MDLSVTQMQNVLRTYQKQVREDRSQRTPGEDEEASRLTDRVEISHEGRNRLEGGDPPRRSGPG
jgi:hypothetical protein